MWILVERNVLLPNMMPKRVSGFILCPEAAGLRKMRERMTDNLVMVPARLTAMPGEIVGQNCRI